MSTFLLIITLFIQNDPLISPDGQFSVKLYGKELGDNQSELSYFLYEKGNADSTLLTTSVIHDLFPPVFWWTSNSKTLIFEHKIEGDSLSVNILDLESRKITHQISGFLNARLNQQEFYMDSNSGFLLYFEGQGQNTIQLLRLNLKNSKSDLVAKFEHWAVYETPQITRFNKSTGELNIVVTGKDYKNETLIYKLTTAR